MFERECAAKEGFGARRGWLSLPDSMVGPLLHSDAFAVGLRGRGSPFPHEDAGVRFPHKDVLGRRQRVEPGRNAAPRPKADEI